MYNSIKQLSIVIFKKSRNPSVNVIKLRRQIKWILGQSLKILFLQALFFCIWSITKRQNVNSVKNVIQIDYFMLLYTRSRGISLESDFECDVDLVVMVLYFLRLWLLNQVMLFFRGRIIGTCALLLKSWLCMYIFSACY